jgi:hypothetical protein
VTDVKIIARIQKFVIDVAKLFERFYGIENDVTPYAYTNFMRPVEHRNKGFKWVDRSGSYELFTNKVVAKEGIYENNEVFNIDKIAVYGCVDNCGWLSMSGQKWLEAWILQRRRGLKLMRALEKTKLKVPVFTGTWTFERAVEFQKLVEKHKEIERHRDIMLSNLRAGLKEMDAVATYIGLTLPVDWNAEILSEQIAYTTKLAVNEKTADKIMDYLYRVWCEGVLEPLRNSG